MFLAQVTTQSTMLPFHIQNHLIYSVTGTLYKNYFSE